MTQRQLAVLAGVWPETISRYERGAIAPTWAAVARLARILGERPEALFPPENGCAISGEVLRSS